VTEFFSWEEITEYQMNALYSTLGLKIAMAISAGGVLVRHSLYTEQAPRTRSDNTIAEADNQKLATETDKTVTPSPQASP